MTEKRPNYIKRSIAIFALISVLFTLLFISGCGSSPKPESSVEGFLNCIKKYDLKHGNKYVEDKAAQTAFDINRYIGPHTSKRIFSKITYKILASSVAGSSSVIKTMIVSENVEKIIHELIPELLSSTFEDTLSTRPKKYSSKKFAKLFIKKVSAKNAPTTSTVVNINLIKKHGRWLIKLDPMLKRSIIGSFQNGLHEMNETANALNQRAANENATGFILYGIGDEAFYRRTSITVLSIKHSMGDSNNKPKAGNEFLVIKLKERNTGIELIEYDVNSFSLRTNRGRIISPTLTSKPSAKSFKYGKLYHGQIIRGSITFEVPKHASNLKLIYGVKNHVFLSFKIK